jgi:hypothetical protein
VPGWKELRAFVDEWMVAPADTIRPPAYVPRVKVEGVDESDEPTVPSELPPEPDAPTEPIVTRAHIAYRHLGGNGVSAMRLRFVLQCIGSFTKALRLVHRDRELTIEERVRFASHARPADMVDWPYIASGTAGLLGALYMMPHGVEE